MRLVACSLAAALMVSCLLGVQAFARGAACPAPPGQASEGYGSSGNYICYGYSRIKNGSIRRGTAVTCFVPDVLKNGDSAPVVVFLHGFLMVRPRIYRDFIEHIVRQGVIVIYPSINPGSIIGVLLDTDQNVMMRRALANARKGLDAVRGIADLSDVTIFGHSLGALLASCWAGSGGFEHKALVLANVATDSFSQIPEFVRKFLKFKAIDWRALSRYVEVPVVLVTGDRDTLSGVPQARELYENMVSAPSRVLYCLQTDEHGRPALRGDHNACVSSFGVGDLLPSWLLNRVFGGDAEVDATDYRCYWAALDAAVDNQYLPTFDMGMWSDGTPVKPVLQLAP